MTRETLAEGGFPDPPYAMEPEDRFLLPGLMNTIQPKSTFFHSQPGLHIVALDAILKSYRIRTSNDHRSANKATGGAEAEPQPQQGPKGPTNGSGQKDDVIDAEYKDVRH